MPALDFDTNGDVLVTFYDRRNSANNHRYQLYSAHINSNGQPLLPDERVNFLATPPNPNWSLASFIGDYHEVWSDTLNGQITWFSSWIRARNDLVNSDNYVSTIRP
jgi:hypothetical protein